MHRDVVTGEQARAKMRRGIDIVAETVGVTLGVKGKNVVLDTNPYADPIITNDGVTIARELTLKDPFENAGSKLIRQVAGKTNDVAGDGTTTATVLMHAIIAQGERAIANGADAVSVRAGIEAASKEIVEHIRSEAVKSDDLETLTSIATISCGDPELGALIAEVVSRAGVEGMVTLEDSPKAATEYEELEGLRLRGGYELPIFVNSPETQQCVLSGVPIVVTNQHITLAQEMGKIMECANQLGAKEVVVIAEAIDADAMSTAIVNTVQQRFRVLPIRVMGLGESGEGLLRDVAAITGARFIDAKAGEHIADLSKDDLGTAQKVVSTKIETTVIADDEELKQERIKELKAQLPTARDYDKQSIKERIAKLRSSMFTVKVGGITDTERTERKMRVEDAINASRAALEDGVVPGGGSTLYRASQALETHAVDATAWGGDDALGIAAVIQACRVPIELMSNNASTKLDRTDYEAIAKPGKSIDFRSGTVVDAHKQGIIDPAKVVISALQNAASGAALFLTTEASVVSAEEPKQERL